MSPDEIKLVVEKVLEEGLGFPWWPYLLFLVIFILGGFLGAYLKKMGENSAANKNYTEILDQIRKTTDTTESIKLDLAQLSWVRQKNWELKEKYYTSLLEGLYKFKESLSSRLDHYIQSGSEYHDESTHKNEHFIHHSNEGHKVYQDILRLHGPSEIVISRRAVEALNELYKVDWNASNFGSCTNEYLTETYKAACAAYDVVLEEARVELK